MDKTVGHIRNPLTVISIFAGIAEISGTAVLPFVAPQNQNLYIWFLMLFPFALVAFFFATLNWNHRVLYAPSDFKDEDNFVSILRNSSVAERLIKISEEAEVGIEAVVATAEAEADLAASSERKEIQILDPAPVQTAHPSIESLLAESTATTKQIREQRAELARRLFKITRHDATLAEKLALEMLSKELGAQIEADKKLEIGRSRYVLDGVINKDGQVVAIEVRYARNARMLGNTFSIGLDSLAHVYESFSEDQRRNFSLILVLVTDEADRTQLEFIKRRLERYPFPTTLKVYDYDSLVQELIPENPNNSFQRTS